MSVKKQDLIIALSKDLKTHIRKPEWADFVKTGVFKEKPPVDSDWWYMRAASVLLKIDNLGPIGVSKLRRKYGGRKNNGVAPEHTHKGSGKIVRVVMQQLEKEGLIKQDVKGNHKGRVTTPKAKSMIIKYSRQLGGDAK